VSTAEDDAGPLYDLLEVNGVQVPHGRLDWLALTWDLTSIKNPVAVCHRFFLTADSYLALNVPRSPSVYQSDLPSIGAPISSSYRHPWALRDALELTEALFYTGHVMVCRPLAVDLSRFQYDMDADGTTYDDASDLVRRIQQKPSGGKVVLGDINKQRQAAGLDYLAPDWDTTTRHTDALALWEGR
jgi:hypothetical protein